ncbi:hypothetical protein N7931_15705 [Catenovulum sp. 2E275]|uniref:anti-sigma factor family protein n=1 Tax=Catenovulum sp. 2E275 TaxID=2980497 RepID=UPI0021CE3920|nr:hypothetical protein [Catenovulum sp. 2E275]MCU4677079.1 hypothetical protein [Catenovulum sp. 2E275]
MNKPNNTLHQVISDEQLSAFLDAELDEREMDKIRQCIEQDEALAERLAELSSSDEIIYYYYDQINQQPLPQKLTNLLEQLPEDMQHQQANKIIELSVWQKIKRFNKPQFAMAASITLVAGLSLAQLFWTNNQVVGQNFAEQNWQEVEQFLNFELSGKSIDLAGNQLQGKLSFMDKQGHYCRQFVITNEQQAQQSIACKINEQWQLLAHFYQSKTQQQEYQTASVSSSLKQTIEAMAQQGAFMSYQDEKNAINKNWNK